MKTIHFPLLVLLVLLAFLMGCTNKEAESLIEGTWYGKVLQLNNDDRTHTLPDGIMLEFEYPRYTFENDQVEHGNYYIKDEKLHLLPDDRDEKREIGIRHLSADSLKLNLIDTLGHRDVLFLR